MLLRMRYVGCCCWLWRKKRLFERRTETLGDTIIDASASAIGRTPVECVFESQAKQMAFLVHLRCELCFGVCATLDNLWRTEIHFDCESRNARGRASEWAGSLGVRQARMLADKTICGSFRIFIYLVWWPLENGLFELQLQLCNDQWICCGESNQIVLQITWDFNCVWCNTNKQHSLRHSIAKH